MNELLSVNHRPIAVGLAMDDAPHGRNANAMAIGNCLHGFVARPPLATDHRGTLGVCQLRRPR
jgi:hypothetical protein